MSGSSVRDEIGQVEDFLINLQSNLRDCKHFAENTRAEIKSMENSIYLKTEDTSQTTTSKIDELLSDLRMEIQSQLDQNVHFTKQIIELKKEKSIMHQRIISSKHRSKNLEEDVGMKKNANDIKKSITNF